MVTAHYFGTQSEVDAFLAASTIPIILFGIFNGALLSALVPVFSASLAAGDRDDAWRLASTVFNGLVVMVGFAAVLGWWLAPIVVPIVAHGFPQRELETTVRMTRWLMPTIVATSLSGVVAAMLNAGGRFLIPALQGIVVNLCTIGITIALFHRLGIFALVLGTAIGLAAQLAVQLPAFFGLRRWQPVLDLRHPGLRRIGQALLPIVLGSAAGQIALFFDRFFASTLSPGYIAGINYATKLVNFPLAIFAAAIATVLFPALASDFASNNRLSVKRGVVAGLRMVNFITIPAVCALLALAGPLVAVLFENGQFRASSTELCAGLLPYACIGLIPMAANMVLTRSCFACGEVRLPVVISVATVLLNVLLSLGWLPALGARGLLLANGLSQVIESLLLAAVVWSRVGAFSRSEMLESMIKVATCAAIMSVVLESISRAVPFPPERWMRTVYLGCEIAAGLTAYAGLAKAMKLAEWRLLSDGIKAKLGYGVTG